jgi:hypothetical protein
MAAESPLRVDSAALKRLFLHISKREAVAARTK